MARSRNQRDESESPDPQDEAPVAPVPQPQTIIVSGKRAEQLARQQLADEMRRLRTQPLDRAPKGGRYLVGGQWVDGNGKPLPDA